MARCRPSCAGILTEAGVPASMIRRVREESKKFLLLHTHGDIGKIRRLTQSEITELARTWVISHGGEHFNRGVTKLVWPEDEDELISQMSRVMSRQKIQTCELHQAKENANQEATTDSSGVARDAQRTQSSGQKRKATEDSEDYRPESTPADSQTVRIYPTRANAQPGMPVLPSVEKENPTPFTSNKLLANKRLCPTSSSQPRSWRAINSPGRAQNQAPGPSSRIMPRRKNGISINIPIRATSSGQPRPQDQPQAASIPNAPDRSVSGTPADQRQHRDSEPGDFRRPYALTGVPMIDEFILENHLHLAETPAEERPMTLAEREALREADRRAELGKEREAQREALREALREAGREALREAGREAQREIEQRSQCEHQPNSEPRCEPTPPRSSIPRGDIEPHTQQAPPAARRTNDRQESEERDTKRQIRLFSLAHDFPNTVDLTGPEVVEIQTGEDEFRIIDKARAPRVLQKLLDVFMSELRICRRNARQAPDGQNKRVWEIKATQLEEVLRTVREDDQVWQGGCTSDRTLAML